MNTEQFQTHNRTIADSQLRGVVTINQGDVHHHYSSEPSQPREPIRLIPYLRNKEFVDRPGLVEKLNALLPHVSESFHDAALWGLGGSGYIALSPFMKAIKLINSATEKRRLLSNMPTASPKTPSVRFSGCTQIPESHSYKTTRKLWRSSDW